MGVFDDHKLEQLDWMTQITETIESDLNTLLAKLPDRTLVTAQDLIENGGSSYLSLSVGNIIHRVERATSSYDGPALSWDEQNKLESCFSFEVDGDVEFNLETHTLCGTITLVKTTQTLSDEDLQPLMGQRGIGYIKYAATHSMERMNEILDILGDCGNDIKGRSGRNKIRRIKARLEEIFNKNEWRIRDMKLANKVGMWIMGYIATANLADLTNLCKLKVMTHSNMPIYSVKEEQ